MSVSLLLAASPHVTSAQEGAPPPTSTAWTQVSPSMTHTQPPQGVLPPVEALPFPTLHPNPVPGAPFDHYMLPYASILRTISLCTLPYGELWLSVSSPG